MGHLCLIARRVLRSSPEQAFRRLCCRQAWPSRALHSHHSTCGASHGAPRLLQTIMVLLPHRGFSAAVELPLEPDNQPALDQDPSPEATAEASSSEDAVQKKKVKKERLPSEDALHAFFQRAEIAERIVDLLKKMPWSDEELKKSLRDILVSFESQVITQVLRADISCDTALSFFKWLKEQDGFKHDEFTYGVMINLLGMSGRLDEMKELFSEMKSEGFTITPVTTSNVMLWLSKGQESEGVEKLWKELKEAGSTPSLVVYTAYIDMLIRTQQFEKVDTVYRRMLSKECLPNNRLYTLFVQHLVAAGKLEAAVQILTISQKVHVVPSRVAYECIINGFAKSGNIEIVQELLKQMKECFLKPSKHLLPTVKVLLKSGKTEEAMALARDISPDLQADNINEIESLDEELTMDSEDGSAPLPETLLNEWRSASGIGFEINAFAYALQSWNPSVEEILDQAKVQWHPSGVLEILKRFRSLETAWPFFHWVKDRPGYKHDSYCCMQMIQRILKSEVTPGKKAALVDALFKEMKEDGMEFVVPMFNMVIRYYVKVGEVDKAVDMFNTIEQYNLLPNEASYAPVIKILAKDRQGKRAMEMMEKMQQAGFHLDDSTCAELITCLELAGRHQAAYDLFERMSESGKGPGGPVYKALMAMYTRQGNQKMALKLYEKMRGSGIPFTQDMFEDVSPILRKANRQADIQAIDKYRATLKYFGGENKALQEDLLKAVTLFIQNMKSIQNLKPKKVPLSSARDEPSCLPAE